MQQARDTAVLQAASDLVVALNQLTEESLLKPGHLGLLLSERLHEQVNACCAVRDLGSSVRRI